MTPRPPKKKARALASVGGSGEGKLPPPHPLARAIEQHYSSGVTPRLVIDARRIDVIVPDYVRRKWGSELVIDLDPSYPLDLAYDEAGVHASLAFSGVVTRCTFAYAAIHRVLDRASGRGILIPAHEPKVELPPELLHIDAKAARPTPQLVALPMVATRSETASASASDDEAKARRAKFRVIDGG